MNQQAQAPDPKQQTSTAQATQTTNSTSQENSSARESMMRTYLDRALQTLQKFGLGNKARSPMS